MKAGIHPELHANATITCTMCSAVYEIPSTVQEIKVEACRSCHPIYTGKQRKELKGGRIERFQKRMAKTEERKK